MAVTKVRMTPEGCEFSRIVWGLGSIPMSTDSRQVQAMLDVCEESGVTTLDNAENYGGHTREKLLGDALALSPSRRDRLQLVTKCSCVNPTSRYPEYGMYHYDTSEKHIIEAAENSLRCFRTDRLDALLLHRPDPLMNVDEVAGAFLRLHSSGKVLHFGVSNFTPQQCELIASRLPFPLITNEIQFSVLHPEPLSDGTLEYCQQARIRPMAWGPLGRGALFHGSGQYIENVRHVLEEIGNEAGGADFDQVALAWILMHPAGVLPILGTDKAHELKKSVLSEQLQLTRQQWYRILIASTGQELP